MKSIFESPQLLTLFGDPFADLSQEASYHTGNGCSAGCENGCAGGCGAGSGSGGVSE